MTDTRDLQARVEPYAEKYGYRKDELGRGLEGYAIHLFVQEEGFDRLLSGDTPIDADLKEFIVRDDDLGIDGYLEDEIGKRIILIQCAWRRKLDEDKVATFFDAPNRLVSVDYVATGGEHVQELLAGLQDKLNDGYQITMRFVSSYPVSDKDRLQSLLEAKNRAYEEQDKPYACELWGPAELLRHESELKSAYTGGFTDEVSLNLQEGNFVQLTSPYRSIIGVIKANELVDVYKRRDVGNRLFNLNIRLPLTSKKVNPRMVDTAASADEAANFLYYNNGVSAVCSGYQLEGNRLTIQRFQIINGAQTVSALVKARRKAARPEVYVLFRLTETEESYGGRLTENIIRYNNTQNPVKVSDFFSNDPIQEWLKGSLDKRAGKGPIPNFYYVPKSGYKPKGATGKALRIEQLAAVRHAFIYGPVTSYREPQSFFDRDARYWEAFGSGDSEVSTWTDEQLAQALAAYAIHEKVISLSKKLKSSEKTKNSDEAKYLYRLARYVTALVGVALETTKDDTFNDYQTLIASQATFDKHVEPLLKLARGTLRREYKAFLDEKPGVQPEYNLARDEARWVRVSDSLREEVLSDLLESVDEDT